jgi:hypothetical protein
MIERSKGRTVSIALAALVALVAVPGGGRAAERVLPDLEKNYVDSDLVASDGAQMFGVAGHAASPLLPIHATIRRPAAPHADIPDYLQPGAHTLEFGPSAVRSMSRWTFDKEHSGPHGDTSDPNVNFDLDKFFEAGKPSVTAAHLHFDELEDKWRNEYAERIDVVGCVTSVGFSTNDWSFAPDRFASADGLFRSRLASERFLAETSTTLVKNQTVRGRTADVSAHVRNLANNPDERAEWFGYVLSGGKEREVSARGDCMSMVFNPRLSITYLVPEGGVPSGLEAGGPPPDLAISNIKGREELEGAVGKTFVYLIEFRNDGAPANGNVEVDIATSGVLTLAEQPQFVAQGWAADGFTCVSTPPTGGANAGLRCSGGSLNRGQSTNPAVMVRVNRAGYGYVHASIGVSSGPAERGDTKDNSLALPVRVY